MILDFYHKSDTVYTHLPLMILIKIVEQLTISPLIRMQKPPASPGGFALSQYLITSTLFISSFAVFMGITALSNVVTLAAEIPTQCLRISFTSIPWL